MSNKSLSTMHHGKGIKGGGFIIFNPRLVWWEASALVATLQPIGQMRWSDPYVIKHKVQNTVFKDNASVQVSDSG